MLDRDEYDCRFSECDASFDTRSGQKSHMGGVHDIRDLLLQDIHRLSSILGHVPRGQEMDACEWTFNTTTYCNMWGSYVSAVKQSGATYKRSKKGLELDPERMIEALRDLADELGRTPTKDEVGQSDTTMSLTAYRNHFDGYVEAIREADLSLDHVNGTVRGCCAPGPDWNEKRRIALDRDNETCQVCVDAMDEDANLNVHHIRPRHVYRDNPDYDWENVNALTNLITLCPTCHGTTEGHFQNADPVEFAKRARSKFDIEALVEFDEATYKLDPETGNAELTDDDVEWSTMKETEDERSSDVPSFSELVSDEDRASEDVGTAELKLDDFSG